MERKSANPRLYQCSAGVMSFHIDPYGKLSLCLMDREQQYDLRLGSFHEGWRGFLAGLISGECKHDNTCSRCNLRTACAQCPAWGKLENGNPEKQVAYLCEITQLRAKAFTHMDAFCH
jgi:radical SAM protein with 4Fe4S-binding SPASM domain